MVLSVPLYFALKDTPQSCGLPPIENTKKKRLSRGLRRKTYENNISAKDIFFKYVFNNRLLWYIAIANVFVYLIRYGIFDEMVASVFG